MQLLFLYSSFHGDGSYERKGCKLYCNPSYGYNFFFYIPVFMEMAAVRGKDVNCTVTRPMDTTSFLCSHFNGGGTPILQATTCLRDLSSVATPLGQRLSILRVEVACTVFSDIHAMVWLPVLGFLTCTQVAQHVIDYTQGSVQDGICARKSPYVLHPVSRKFPQHCP